jgi:SAM-dependent methyltransferase
MAAAPDRYDQSFFENIEEGSRHSAQKIVPLVLSLLGPKSVVDVGCGEGSWLAEFLRHGIDDVRGLDGAYVPTEVLKIPAPLFARCDLRRSFSLDRQFDLAISMETAEHLPPARAEGLVADLVRLSPHVLFSAAIPWQRGHYHLNCQWPDYWQKLFRHHDYLAFDIIRPQIWNDDTIEFWYRQNSILYVRRDHAEKNPALRHLMDSEESPVQRCVHPTLCESWEGYSVRELLAMVPSTVRRAVKRRWRSHVGQHLPGMALVNLVQRAGDRVWETLRFWGIQRTYRNFTMLKPWDVIANLHIAAKAASVPGCVVECGVWRGGMSAAMVEVLGQNRDYFLFDSFEGLPPAKGIDGQAALQWQSNTKGSSYFNNCTASQSEAEAAMQKSRAGRYTIVKGWFDNTLPAFRPPCPIAVIRLDGDWYDSTMSCLTHLVPHLAENGVVIIDDYHTWEGCARAVNEYIAAHRPATRIRQHWNSVAYFKV